MSRSPNQDQQGGEKPQPSDSQSRSQTYLIELSSGEYEVFAASDIEAAYQGLELSKDNESELIDVTMAKKPYFHNNWQRYKDADEEMFEPHTFFELMHWKVAGWELPSDVYCIIRTTHLSTMKVDEFVYKRQINAEKKVVQLLKDQTHEFCITTHDAQHFIGPGYEDDDEGDV